MAEPKDIATLVRSIDENYDPLHVDVTPSVLKLIDAGLDGAAAVLDLLNSPQPLTRRRAKRVVEGAVLRHVGEGTGERTRAVIAENGYDPDAGEPQRREAIERWRRWLEREMKKGGRDE
jgi:hypothetical protein